MTGAAILDRGGVATGRESVDGLGVPSGPVAGGGAMPDVPQVGDAPAARATGEDPLAFVRSMGGTADQAGPAFSTSWKPARSMGMGGGALPTRGGSGGPSSPPIIATPARPASGGQGAGSSASAASSSALLSTLGLDGAGSAAPASTTITRNAMAQQLVTSKPTPMAIPMTGGGSPAFTLATLDYNDGSTMVPGADQLATPGGSVDLRAQVIDPVSGTYTYSWNTSGLTDATGISGSSTYDLTFHWNTSIATAGTQTATLTVTDPDSSQVSQTYTFWAPAGTGSTTGGTTWPTSLDPGLISAGSPAIASQNVSVVSATGSAETSIAMPSFNPNVAPVSLQYDSLSANALPIIDIEHPLDPTKATPSTVTAKLTFNGTAGTTWYYNTSSMTPGDIMQIGLQANATGLSTGRYSYSATVADDRGGTLTTFTYSGTATIINEAKDPTFSALGAGWTVSGLEKIVSASGGVILDEGSGAGLWYSGSFGGGGGTYSSPAGNFDTLVLNSNGTYKLTLTDGTVENFNSSGLETSSVAPNSLTTTFGYSGNLLQTVTDPFSEIMTLTYSSGSLQSIKDPAARLATFTMSGGDLTAVEYPDASTWDYGYDSSGRLTTVTEPSSTGEPTKTTTITYDSAERVGTITRADSTTEEFSSAQEQGWTDTGTSGSPATPTLLVQVGSTYTDPMGDTTTSQPDWRGMGLTDQTIDALGNVTTVDRDANGLATITIDPMNRISQAAYDSKGNVTKVVNPDGGTVAFGTYNSFAEPATMTDELGRTTTYTYDSNGNMTVVEDPMEYVKTYTYSSSGMVTAQTAPAPAGQSSDTLYGYQYDSDDRQTTITDADSDVTSNVYNSAGQVTKTTDPGGNITTYSYDPMNRVLAETTAAGTALAGVTSFTYDKAGNQLTSTDPLGDITTMTYDAMDRQATVENADGAVTTLLYDDNGQMSTLIDPVGNRTTFMYDALGRQTEEIAPSVNSGSGVDSYTQYDADGEVTQTTDADGRVVTYSYDSRGDQTGETWLNGSGDPIYTATYTYDADQEMTGAADNNSLLTMTYDNDGRLGTIATSGPGTDQPTVTLTYGYDPSGDVTSLTDSLSGSGGAGQGITSYVYDPALRLGTITQSMGGTTGPEATYAYDPSGLETEESLSIGGSGTILQGGSSYNAAEEESAGSFTGLPTFSYSYDEAGRLTQETDPVRADSFGYDNAGQVTSASYPITSTIDNYSYDANGNRDSTGYTTGAGNELTESPASLGPTMTYDTYRYDNDGNIISATAPSGTTTYTYDYENRLTSVDRNGTVVASYTYDALGRRIETDDNGTKTWTVYNGTSADANPYADFTGSGNLTERYLYAPGLVDGSMTSVILARTDSGGNTAWYWTDNLGSVRAIVSPSGTTLDSIVYDPFGNILSESNPSEGDRFKYAGMQYDTATGLFYDHARVYDAAIGRFTSQDPKRFAGGDDNLYRYVYNSTTAGIDPTGESFLGMGIPSLSDYKYYLFNPSEQDTNIQVAQGGFLVAGAIAGTAALGLALAGGAAAAGSAAGGAATGTGTVVAGGVSVSSAEQAVFMRQLLINAITIAREAGDTVGALQASSELEIFEAQILEHFPGLF